MAESYFTEDTPQFESNAVFEEVSGPCLAEK